MRLWLDDCRPAPEGWVHAPNVAVAKDLAEKNEIEEMSLDHDLGPAPACPTCVVAKELRPDDSYYCDDGVECRCSCHRELQPTGYDFVKWMAETGRWPTIKPRVHSMNPVGRANMQAVIDRYWFNPRIN
jgi:hypothetical protein